MDSIYNQFPLFLHKQLKGGYKKAFIEKKNELISLNDPINTSSAQGWMVFGIFATLPEFERELIREGTQAGQKAAIAEALYPMALPVKKIAEQLGISKATLYLYLRSQNVLIGEKTEVMIIL